MNGNGDFTPFRVIKIKILRLFSPHPTERIQLDKALTEDCVQKSPKPFLTRQKCLVLYQNFETFFHISTLKSPKSQTSFNYKIPPFLITFKFLYNFVAKFLLLFFIFFFLCVKAFFLVVRKIFL